jgi:hypothetical protein
MPTVQHELSWDQDSWVLPGICQEMSPSSWDNSAWWVAGGASRSIGSLRPQTQHFLKLIAVSLKGVITAIQLQ